MSEILAERNPHLCWYQDSKQKSVTASDGDSLPGDRNLDSGFESDHDLVPVDRHALHVPDNVVVRKRRDRPVVLPMARTFEEVCVIVASTAVRFLRRQFRRLLLSLQLVNQFKHHLDLHLLDVIFCLLPEQFIVTALKPVLFCLDAIDYLCDNLTICDCLSYICDQAIPFRVCRPLRFYKGNGVFKSDDSGKVLLEKLKVRTAPYYVKETKAPEGYTAQNTVWVLTVRKANSTMKVYGGGNTPVDTVGNETIRIRKLSRGIQPEEVVGAELALYKLGSANPIEQWRTGAEPHILSRWLEDGKYILKELVVPEGYLIPEEDVVFEVKNGIPLTTDVLTYDSTIGEYTIVVYNTSSISLPATGSPGSKGVRIAGGVLLAMCAMGCTVIRKKREE